MFAIKVLKYDFIHYIIFAREEKKEKFYFIHNTENTKISKKHALQKQMLINKTKKYGM